MSWQIDPAHSSINFTARHMMITKVHGRFEQFTGTINFDEANPANTTADITIDAASLNTKEDQRDGHLRSGDFFGVETYPALTFKSTRVELTDTDNAKLYGNLTIKDVTKEVVLDVEYLGQAQSPWGTTNAGFAATTTINRKDWGLNWNVALETGGFLVGDKIQINIELELVKQPQPEAAAAA
ncbi:MAG: YceI family protein [Ardenticatenaceae bacterium]|nr:YceI family protein [Ardenticatenaceae bacterium]